MSSPAIELRGLRKRYGAKLALDGVDLVVEPGTVQGYIGANGAGKTTTVRILIGLLDGFEGEARVAGFDPRTEQVEVKRRIGYVPENAALFDTMTVAEYLLFVGRLHDLDDTLVIDRCTEFLGALDLTSRLVSRIASLSKGMRQKLLFCAALVHDPEVLFLDEPLTGLDVNASILIKELIKKLADRGRTIFYCSHVLDVVERVCDRIAIVDEGKLAAEGTFAELVDQRGIGSLEGILASLTAGGGEEEKARRILAALSGDD